MSDATLPPTSTAIDGLATHPGRPAVPTLEELGLRNTLFLAALLRAQAQRVPVAPTHSSALSVLDALQVLALIQVPWPADRWKIRPDAEVTPLEDLQWAFSWSAHDRKLLLPALEDQLSELALSHALVEERVALWDELAIWETEHFLEQQLRKHQFDANWARDLRFVFHSAPVGLPIAQWRYCCWAAVRQGASVALRRSLSDGSCVREAIFQEMHNRLRYLERGSTQLGMFTPFHVSPASALAQLFMEYVVPTGWAYWTSKRIDSEVRAHMRRIEDQG
ncbi:hypothetical protein MUU77_17400 [Pseudoxanthomonas sp. F37]|uniref:hypothetical protein n=1 Tax=Pseudoxanthomonas sp. F37 TaxID=2932492 RepID=UPI001FD3B13C|nr:hypothetical protein [Pseudoxanthomonas sp. F37]UOV08555.1 hypothetical protein MUU77_17400 [Pseudoxanthomonas sp. F37]